MSGSRHGGWQFVGIASGVLAVFVVLVLLFPDPTLRAVGLTRGGGAPTIAPEVFPSAPDTPTPPANLEAPPLARQGVAPNGAVLQARLDALDISKIVTDKGERAEIGYEIVDVSTGSTLAKRNAGAMFIPASNTKTLTAVAVMQAFDGQERFRTTVTLTGDQLTLVGGGDPLLRSTPAPAGTYPAAASLVQLADKTAAELKARGVQRAKLGVDTTWFEGDGWAKTWPEMYRNQVTEIQALWVDLGKTNKVRSRTPAIDAAKAFATLLAERGVVIQGEPTSKKAAGDEIAAVESLTVQELVEYAMVHSDNSVTEMLGFQLAKKMGKPATFADSVAAVEEQLRGLKLWDDGAHLDDASGLSRSNRFTPTMLARVNLAVLKDARLSGILDGLPVAGATGTLRTRFTSEASKPAVGVAKAKTGTLSQVSSLGGITVTLDGAVVVYGIMANGMQSAWGAKVWEDEIVGVISGCGC